MKTTVKLTSNADRAVLYAALAQARRIPLCAMCAGIRKVMALSDGEYIVCQHCGDAVPVTKEEDRATRL
jgi:RNA polymerase-binding transcription factor DksA